MARLHGQEQRHVADGAPHRPLDPHLGEEGFELRPGRHAALGRPEPVDVVVGRRVAQRAAHVASVGNGEHIERQGDGGATAGAARAQALVDGIARRAEDGVVGLRAEAEFGDVGLADDDGAGGADALDVVAVFRGYEIGEDRRAEGGPEAARLGEVLDGDGQAVQRAGRPARRQRGVGGVGLSENILARPPRDDGVDGGIDRVDAVEEGRDHLAGRQLPPAQALREQPGRHPADVTGFGD